jgi:hypothetical protein
LALGRSGLAEAGEKFGVVYTTRSRLYRLRGAVGPGDYDPASFAVLHRPFN